MPSRPFRFGLVAGQPADLRSWTQLAARAESDGFDTLLVTDPVYSAGGETLDPFAALPAAAAATETLRVGTFVLAEPLRERAALRWQARSLSWLTGGRFELGIGVGRPDTGARAASLGREFGPVGRRLTELERTLDTLAADDDRAPLLLAGARPRMLRLAAERADICTFAWPPDTTEEAAQSIVDEFRRLAGARLPDIELAANLVAVGDGPAPWLKRFTGFDPADLAASGAVTVLPGDPAAGADTLRRWRDRFGISYFTINAAFADAFAPIVARLRGD